MIVFKCPGCEKSFSVKDEFAGKHTKCPQCGNPLRVPAGTAPAVSAPEPTPPAKVAFPPPAKVAFPPPAKVAPPPPAIVQPALPVQAVPEVLASRRAVDYKDCPFCGEEVLAAAKKCKHCGETLDVALRSAEEARRIAQHSSPGGGGGGGGGAASSTVIIQQLGGGTRSFAGWHLAHLILTIVTCGLWLPVWLIHWVIWLSMK
jgi:predicted RNA-binding Zn-ribbon protein involved in translation (DUF1610 family)